MTRKCIALVVSIACWIAFPATAGAIELHTPRVDAPQPPYLVDRGGDLVDRFTRHIRLSGHAEGEISNIIYRVSGSSNVNAAGALAAPYCSGIVYVDGSSDFYGDTKCEAPQAGRTVYLQVADSDANPAETSAPRAVQVTGVPAPIPTNYVRAVWTQAALRAFPRSSRSYLATEARIDCKRLRGRTYQCRFTTFAGDTVFVTTGTIAFTIRTSAIATATGTLTMQTINEYCKATGETNCTSTNKYTYSRRATHGQYTHSLRAL